ncbi:hypothetical protein M8J77_011714 [Diaphorina citri]|nr:hypothetical protein M8J77_011714 [Diaphorina citri]
MGEMISEDVPFCFVCDHPICGSYFNLSQCVTEQSHTKMSTKLAQMVGEEYLVVIEEPDVICRSCWSILNTMDRLESQLANLGNTILNFLEDKYALQPGEIFQNIPPLQIIFKKESTKQGDENNEQNDNSKDGEEKESEFKPMHCPECNYVTQFNAYMVFHMREHNRLKNPTPIETTEEETNQASCKKTSRGRKLKQVGEGGGKKRNKSLLSEEEMTNVQVDGIHSTGDMDNGTEFAFIATDNNQMGDQLSEEMLNKVNSLVQSAGGGELEEETGEPFTVQMNAVPGECLTQGLEDSSGIRVFQHELLEVEGEPNVFCMLDSKTGRVVKRLKKIEDGSFERMDMLESDSHAVMHQLDDGTLAMVSLTGLQEDTGDLSLM